MAPVTATALALALRRAETRAAVDDAVERALEQLVATESLAEAQQLSLGIAQCADRNRLKLSSLPADFYTQRIRQPAAVCAEPADKAAFLGFELLSHALNAADDGSQAAELVRGVYAANPGVLEGLLSALETLDVPEDSREPGDGADRVCAALDVVSPAILTALTNAKEPAGSKLACVELLSRLAWRHSGNNGGPVALKVSRLVLAALRSHYPLSAVDATAYAAMVASVVDLVTSLPHDQAVELAASTCKAVLATVEHLYSRRLPVTRLLQALERLAAAVPEAAWRSDVLVWCAFFLTTDTTAPVEQRLVLKVLRHAVALGKNISRDLASGIKSRGVYVEALVLPLASMLPTEGQDASRLLQDVTGILAAQVPFREASLAVTHKHGERVREGNSGDIAAHATSFLTLIGREAEAVSWLASLSADSEANNSASALKPRSTATAADKSTSECWTVLLLSSLLFDERSGLRGAAASALERQSSQRHTKFWSPASTKLLVSGIVFLLSQKTVGSSGSADWRATCLYALASLAASANDTMKVVLRLVDSMKAVDALRATALKLLFAVWERESRIYPRLESMLLEDEPDGGDAEYHIVRMATLKALCASDPEAGVEFIGPIQECLEDPLVSVAGMALDAIAALCRGDCLDFYAAFKIIALKTRKKKISCAGDPHFQEKLCLLYALGASSEMEENGKQASKLLAQLWEFAETSEYAAVRCAALTSLSAFPLEAIDLVVSSGQASGGADGQDESEEEEEDNTALLLDMLATEEDEATRKQVEVLVTRVLEHESRRHTAGIGRGQMKNFSSLDPSQQLLSVSAAATKELRRRLLSRDEAIKLLLPSDAGVSSSLDSLVGFLMAYQPPIDDAGSLEAQRKGGKRKDRLVRVAAQDVEACEVSMQAVDSRMDVVLPWSLEDGSKPGDCSALLSTLSLMEGWQAFMATYVTRLEEFVNLKVPASAEEGSACAFFVDLVKAQVEQLLMTTDGDGVAGIVAAGALVGQLCESLRLRSGRRRYWGEESVRAYFMEAVTAQCRVLLRVFEEGKVFRSPKQQSSLVAAMLSVQLALVNVLPARRTTLTTEMSASDNEWASALAQVLSAPMDKVLVPLSRDSSAPEVTRAVAVLGIGCVGGVLSKSGSSERVKPVAHLLVVSAFASLGINVSEPAIDAMFAVDSAVERGVDQVIRAVKQAKTSAADDDRISALAWASFIGLAQLAPHFGSMKKLQWLRNLQSVLLAVWDSSTASSLAGIVGVALGPVLLESVRFGISSSSTLDTFLSACEARMEVAAASPLAPSEQLGAASVFAVVPFMLSRMTVYAGSASIQRHFSTFVDCTHSALASARTNSANSIIHGFALTGIANCFGHALGVTLVDVNDAFPPPPVASDSGLEDELSVEMPFDTDAVARLTQSLRDEAQHNGRALAVFGAVARHSSAFYAPQKKKALDVEMRALPANGLFFRALELLLQASLPSSSANTSKQQTNALLSCLAKAGKTLPLFDYAPLVTRLMARLCCDDTSAICIRLASSQGSCDALLIHGLATSTAFPVAPPVVQVEVLAGVPRVAVRIPLEALAAALDAVSQVVFESRRAEAGGAASSSSTDDYPSLFSSWIDMLSALVSPTTPIADETRELVAEKVLGDYLGRLPLDSDGYELARAFASRVLTPMDCLDRVTDALLQSTKGVRSPWAWWRDGTVFTELVMSTSDGSGARRLIRRELALLVQWLLRHDFKEWVEHTDAAPQQALSRLLVTVARLISANTRHQDESAVSSLLDLVDGYARSLVDVPNRAALAKASALFELVARVCCLSWRECLPFEEFQLTAPTAFRAGADCTPLALRLAPTALLRCAGASKRWLPLYEQLWAVAKQQQQSWPSGEALAAHTLTLELSFLLVAGAAPIDLPAGMKTDVDRWWSSMATS